MLPVEANAATDAWSSSPANGNFSGTNWTLGSITPGAATGTAATGDTLYFGTSSTTSLTNSDTSFNFAGLVFNSGASQYNISGNSFTLSGNILNYSATTQIIGAPIVLGANDSVYTAAGGTTNLSGGISGTGFGLTAFGTGTLNLTGSDSYTGTTAINGGTVSLTGSLASTSSLSLGGGTLSYAPATAGTQTFAATSFTPGGSTVNATAGSTLALGTVTRTLGATADFNSSGVAATITGTASSLLVNGVLPWAIVGSGSTARFATVSGTTIAGYSAATQETTTASAWGGIASGGTGTINYDITISGTPGATGLDRDVNTLRFTGTGLNQSGNNTGVLLNTNAILNVGTGPLNLATSGSLFGITPANTNELVLAAVNAPINVYAYIANNASTATVTTTGPNSVTLGGLNTFTGDLIIDGGTVFAPTANAAGTGGSTLGALEPASNRNITINSGATLSLTGGNILGTGGSTNNLSNNTLVVNAGGVFQTGLNGSGSGWWNKIGNVNLNGGSIIVGTGANNTTYQALALIGNVNVSGSVPSTITSFSAATSGYTGIHLGQNATASQVVTFNVADVTNDANPDLTVTVPLINTSATLTASGFTKTGAGTMLLTGASAFTGPTTISAGTLQLGNGTTGNDGDIAATSGVTNNATLVYNRFGTSTAPYAISGSGNVVKIGPGNEILTGSESYTGATSINAGTLTLSGGGTITAGQVNISGGTFASNGSSSVSAPVVLQKGAISTVDQTFNSFNFASINVSGGSSSFNMEAGTSNQTDQININNALTLSSAGATINLLGAVAGQTYSLMNFGSASYNGTAFTNSSGSSSAEGLTLVTPFGVSGTLNITPNSVQVVTTGGSAPTAAYWTGAQGANWTDYNSAGGNFTTTLNGSTLISALPASTTNVYFANSGATNLSTTLGTQNFDINSLNFLASTGAVSIANGTFGTTLTLEAGGLNVASGAGAVTISTTTLTLNADQIWTNSSTNPVTVSSAIGGSHALTLTGGGQFNLSNAANTYTNGTLVTGGSTLAVTAPGGLGGRERQPHAGQRNADHQQRRDLHPGHGDHDQQRRCHHRGYRCRTALDEHRGCTERQR
jgi:autotransporter-associated beta strand protein